MTAAESTLTFHQRTADVEECEGAAAGARALDYAEVPIQARQWTGVAVASLVVAGLLSLAVVVGRLPVLSNLIGDPLFFKRCLVVHVDLALLVWFYAFIAALSSLRAPVASGWQSRLPLTAAVIGMAGMLGGAMVPGAEPVLANYIPVIDHPLFLTGLAIFFAAVVLFFLRNLLARSSASAAGLPGDAALGLQAAAVAMVLAGATWISAQAGLPRGLDAKTFFEFSAWGAGHVLQVANTCAMLAVWLWLISRATGKAVLSTAWARVLFTALVAPHFVMPLLSWRGSLNNLYIHGATLMMRWGIFPVVVTILILCIRHLRVHRGQEDDFGARAARAGFWASVGLAVLGIVLGAMIRGSTTLIPAHYHASLGAVTAAFMAAAYLIIEAVARDQRRTDSIARLWCMARRQIRLFGLGQAVFAIGFGIGGFYGLGRKAYAGEQHVRSAGELAGLAVMGAGGLLAVIAGLWFLFLVIREMRCWHRGPILIPHSIPTSARP